MKFLKYNRTAAILCMVAAVLLAIPLGMHRSLSSLAGKVEKIYSSGSDRYGTAREDVAKAVTHAENLYAIYAAVYAPDTGYADALSEARAAMESPLTSPDAFSAMTRAAAAMYQKMSVDAAIPEAQSRSAKSYFYEIESTRMRLAANEEYARAAEKYNDACRTFPASLLPREAAITFAS